MNYSANGNFINNNNKSNKIIEHWSTEGTLYTANGNVGILTNNPQARLDVNGNIKASGDLEIKNRNANLIIDGVDYDPVIRLINNDVSGWTIRNSVPNNNIFSIGKDENPHILNITDTKKIGINKTNPSYLLDIQDSKKDHLVNIDNQDNQGSGLKITASKNPFQIVGNDNLETKHFTIKGNGRIGIGTENPGSLLEINSFQDNELVRIKNQNDQGSGLSISSNNYPLRVGGKDDYSGEYLIVKGNGNVGIGNKNPQKKLVVNGTIQADEFINKDGTVIGGKQNFVLEGSNVCLNNGLSGNDYEKICLGINDFKFISNLRETLEKTLPDKSNHFSWIDNK